MSVFLTLAFLLFSCAHVDESRTASSSSDQLKALSGKYESPDRELVTVWYNDDVFTIDAELRGPDSFIYENDDPEDLRDRIGDDHKLHIVSENSGVLRDITFTKDELSNYQLRISIGYNTHLHFHDMSDGVLSRRVSELVARGRPAMEGLEDDLDKACQNEFGDNASYGGSMTRLGIFCSYGSEIRLRKI